MGCLLLEEFCFFFCVGDDADLWNPPDTAIPQPFDLTCIQQSIHCISSYFQDITQLLHCQEIILVFEHDRRLLPNLFSGYLHVIFAEQNHT